MIASWNDYDMDWNDPDPDCGYYWEALRMAICERMLKVGITPEFEFNIPIAEDMCLTIPKRNYLHTYINNALKTLTSYYLDMYDVPEYLLPKYEISEEYSVYYGNYYYRLVISWYQRGRNLSWYGSDTYEKYTQEVFLGWKSSGETDYIVPYYIYSYNSGFLNSDPATSNQWSPLRIINLTRAVLLLTPSRLMSVAGIENFPHFQLDPKGWMIACKKMIDLLMYPAVWGEALGASAYVMDNPYNEVNSITWQKDYTQNRTIQQTNDPSGAGYQPEGALHITDVTLAQAWERDIMEYASSLNVSRYQDRYCYFSENYDGSFMYLYGVGTEYGSNYVQRLNRYDFGILLYAKNKVKIKMALLLNISTESEYTGKWMCAKSGDVIECGGYNSYAEYLAAYNAFQKTTKTDLFEENPCGFDSGLAFPSPDPNAWIYDSPPEAPSYWSRYQYAGKIHYVDVFAGFLIHKTDYAEMCLNMVKQARDEATAAEFKFHA